MITSVKDLLRASGYTSPLPAPENECGTCGAEVDSRTAKYSSEHYGRILCRSCQGSARASMAPAGKSGTAEKCVKCGAPVSVQVAEFCKKNARFGGKIYCRDCQTKISGLQSANTAGPAARGSAAETPPVAKIRCCAKCGAGISPERAAWFDAHGIKEYLCRTCRNEQQAPEPEKKPEAVKPKIQELSPDITLDDSFPFDELD